MKRIIAAFLFFISFSSHAQITLGGGGNGGSGDLTLTTTGTAGASTLVSGTLNIPQYQGALTLTTTGSSGPATLIGATLNIPQYSGGGGAVTRIIAGNNVTISPTNGLGDVTINASGGGGGTPGGSNHSVQFNASGSFGGTAFTGIVKASTTADPVAASSVDLAAINGVVTNPASTQLIAQPAGTHFGLTYTNWDSNSQQMDALPISCSPLSTYQGDTGGTSVNGNVNCLDMYFRTLVPGWNTGTSINGASNWYVSSSVTLNQDKQSAGIGNGLQTTLRCYGDGDCNGIVNNNAYGGGWNEFSGEGATAIHNSMTSVLATTAVIASGGSGATTVTVNSFSQVPGVGQLAIDGSTSTVTTQTLVGKTGENSGVAIETLGTTLATPSVCGTLAGGPLMPSTSYTISGNTLTVQATNTLWNGEQVTLSGYATSTFLNGVTVTVNNVSGTFFQAYYIHADASATEAGQFSTLNVDTPRAANNGTTLMTFRVTLGAAYTGSSTALFTFAGAASIETSALTSVGAYSDGTQLFTAQLMRPMFYGTGAGMVCIGGTLQGYYDTNTDVTGGNGGFYNYVVGNTTTTAYVTAIRQGAVNNSMVIDGNISLRPGAEIQAVTTNSLSLRPNQGAWPSSGTIILPPGISSRMSAEDNTVNNANPFSQFALDEENYAGTYLFGGGDFHLVQSVLPNSLKSHGSYGFAPNFATIIGSVGAVFVLNNPPDGAFVNGNQFKPALFNVNCQIAPCNTQYDLFADNFTSGNQLAYDSVARSLDWRAQGAGGPVTFEVNDNVVCDMSGNCPSGFPITIGSTSIAASSTTTTIAGLTLTSPTLTNPALGTIASGVGTALTALNASNLGSGTVPVARLPLGTTSAPGALQPDGTTITVSGGVISSTGGGGGITALTGDVTAAGPGSAAASVVRVNGASLPVSTAVVGTNSSGQIVGSANVAFTNVANVFNPPSTGQGQTFVQSAGSTTTCANSIVTFEATATTVGCMYYHTGTSIIHFGTLNGSHPYQFDTPLNGTEFVGTGTPTIAVGPAAGTGGSATITGNNLAGIVTVVSGTATVGSATLATITFSPALTVAPQGCDLMSRNANAVAQVGTVYTTAPTTTSWTIAIASSAIPISTTNFQLSYQCM